MKEIFKKVNFGIYRDMYDVSNLGRVKSYHYRRDGKPIILKPGLDGSGYPQVYLFKDQVGKMAKVHKLVALTFIPNPENKPEVNHIDEIKIHNWVLNLEWTTHKENVRHSRAKPIAQFDLNGNLIAKYSCARDVGNDIGYRGISRCALGQRKTYKGFNWEYIKVLDN